MGLSEGLVASDRGIRARLEFGQSGASPWLLRVFLAASLPIIT